MNVDPDQPVIASSDALPASLPTDSPILRSPPAARAGRSRLYFPFFDRLRVGQKIAVGYGLALAIGIGGTVAGILIGNYYQAAAWRRVELSNYESDLLVELRFNALKARIEHQKWLIQSISLPSDLTDPEALSSALDLEKKLTLIWMNIQIFPIHYPQFAEQYGSTARRDFVRLNNRVLTQYFSELRSLQQEIRRLQIRPEYEPQLKKRLQQAYLDPTSQDFDRLILDLNQLQQLVADENLRAQAEIRSVNQQAMVVTIVSLLLSTAVAAIIGLIISRRIGKTLRNVDQTAQLVIQSGDFDRRCSIETQDEIGALASSINQLIEWVGLKTDTLETICNTLESTVQSRTQELNAIIDHLGDGLIVCDAQGQIVRSNPTFQSILNLEAPLLRMPSTHPIFDSAILRLIQTHYQDPQPIVTEILLPQGRIGQVVLTPIWQDSGLDVDPSQRLTQGASGRLAGSVMLVRDITHEKEIDQMKTDFLSTVSHELRTPLTSVLGFAKLIQKKMEDVLLPLMPERDKKVQRTTRQVRDNLAIIIAEGERLTTLINDVLDIAKIESGKVEWHLEPLQMESIIDRAIAATSILSTQNHLEIIRCVEPNLPDVLIDRDRLIQVVINLISNAIKFTDHGSVTCRLLRQGDEIQVRIEDTGIGLDASDLDKVFEKFKQVGEVMTDKPKGTGLGLPICKQIIEHHGGRIWAESQLGIGSQFIFTLPVCSSLESRSIETTLSGLSRALAPLPLSSDSSSKMILVVDDEPNIRQLLRQEIELQNYSVIEAHDGMHALQQVRQYQPDLIILDVMMPNMNGFDLAAILKNNPETAMIPIIILSIVEDQQRGYNIGVDRYQSKPINRENLLLDIELLLSQGQSNKRVVIFDRCGVHPINHLIHVLLDRGYVMTESITGHDGREALISSLHSHMVIVDSAVAQTEQQVNALQFEKGDDRIYIILSMQSELEARSHLLSSPPAIPVIGS